MTKKDAEVLNKLIKTLEWGFSLCDNDSEILKAVVFNTALRTVKELVKEFADGNISQDVLQDL